MLILAVHETPTLTRERYEQVVRMLTNGKPRIEVPSDLPFEGLLVHAAGEGPNGFLISVSRSRPSSSPHIPSTSPERSPQTQRSSSRPANACGHTYSLQIRSHVSNVGQRSLASSSRYSRTLIPKRQAVWHSRIPQRAATSGDLVRVWAAAVPRLKSGTTKDERRVELPGSTLFRRIRPQNSCLSRGTG